jgi:hypothetical protein
MDAVVAGGPMRSSIVAVLGLIAGVGAAGAQQTTVQTPRGPVQLAVGPPVQVNPNSGVVANQPGEPIVITVDRGSAIGCPGQLTAQQRAGGGQTVWTGPQGNWNAQSDANKPGLGVRVAFQGGKTIRSLELRVSYLPPGLRFMPMDTKQTTKDMRESDKTFVLQDKDGLRVVGDLLVGPAATITRVHLMSVTYADGSVWHPSSDEQCSVVPNRVMEVAAK